jgi:branched-chain amino acid transport system substrate-binding protein
MTRDIDDSVNRRTVLKTAGATGVTAGLGGCSALFGGDGDDGGDGDGGDGDGGDGDGGGGDGAATTDEQISSDPLSAGLLSFTKGPAAVLGLQAVRGAEKAVEMINANGGIAGTRQVNLDVRDEGDNPLDKYQSFIDSGMDVTFGPISSGTHKQLAPNVESNEVVHVGTDGTVTTLYEETVPDPTYSFRFQNYDIMETTTAALEAVDRIGADNIDTVAGVNPNYAFGQDEMNLFSQAIQQLTGAEIVYSGLPDLLAGDYATHISAINGEAPDIVFSSLWGGDASSFLEQATSRGMFENVEGVFGPVFYGSADAIPEAVLTGPGEGKIFAGSRNYYWDFPSTERWPPGADLFEEARSQEGIKVPTAHYMSGFGAVMAWATAVEKAIDMLDSYPSQQQIALALEEHGFSTPAGYHTVSQDHQVRSNSFAGVMTWDSDIDAPALEDVDVFSATQVSPPPQGSRYEATASDWLSGWN